MGERKWGELGEVPRDGKEPIPNMGRSEQTEDLIWNKRE